MRHWFVHVLRLAVVASLVLALRAAADQRRQGNTSVIARRPVQPPATLYDWFGAQARWGESAGLADQPSALAGTTAQLGGWPVVDDQNRPLGWWMQTSPLADSVTGYRGPSNLQIGLSPSGRIVGVRLVKSEDTPEHVAAIRRAPRFFDQFVGRTADDIADSVDVVSGATLTSLAMAGAVAHRLGAVPSGSTRFPRPIALREARQFFPDATALRPAVADGDDRSVVEGAEQVAVGPDGAERGRLIRTGPLCDHIHGYQGPTELLVAIDPRRTVTAVAVRGSFDNQPYVSYLDDEPWFWDPFVGQSWQSVASVDLAAEGVEGVSGATMTSLAAAETLVASAAEHVRRRQAAAEQAGRRGSTVRWSLADAGTVTVVILGLALGRTHLRGRRWSRWLWQLTVVIYVGWVTGNLLSIALLMGWAASGVPWWLAPGLTVVLAAALAVPAVTKSPFYCAQLCPHGAVQQWLRGAARWQWHPRPRLVRWLVRIPAVLLTAAYVVALVGIDANLAAWEPFDAYLWPIGAAGAVVVAALSLALASVSPMAYCRFGCPTGQVLRYVRRHGRSQHWTIGDTGAVAAAIAAWAWIWLQ